MLMGFTADERPRVVFDFDFDRGIGSQRLAGSAMSLAHVEFGDPLSRTLLVKGAVALGPLLPQDAGAMYIWMNDIEAMSQDLPYRPTDGSAVSSWLASFSVDPSRVLFAIRLANKPQAVGFVLFTNINSTNRAADLGIRIGFEADRNRGVGTAAVVLAMNYGWDHLNLVRIQLRVVADNVRAIGAYRAAGFATEGQHVQAAFIAGKWRDMLTMAAINPHQAVTAA